MKATLLLSVVLALSATTAAGATAFARTTHPRPPAHITFHAVPSATTHKVKSVIVNSGNYDDLGTGNVSLDVQTFACNSKTGSCTLSMSGIAFICNFSDTETTGAGLVFYVDGNLTQFFENDLPPNFCGPATAMVNYSVSPGSHTVTFGEEGSANNFIHNWDDRIDILVP